MSVRACLDQTGLRLVVPARLDRHSPGEIRPPGTLWRCLGRNPTEPALGGIDYRCNEALPRDLSSLKAVSPGHLAVGEVQRRHTIRSITRHQRLDI